MDIAFEIGDEVVLERSSARRYRCSSKVPQGWIDLIWMVLTMPGMFVLAVLDLTKSVKEFFHDSAKLDPDDFLISVSLSFRSYTLSTNHLVYRSDRVWDGSIWEMTDLMVAQGFIVILTINETISRAVMAKAETSLLSYSFQDLEQQLNDRTGRPSSARFDCLVGYI